MLENIRIHFYNHLKWNYTIGVQNKTLLIILFMDELETKINL